MFFINIEHVSLKYTYMDYIIANSESKNAQWPSWPNKTIIFSVFTVSIISTHMHTEKSVKSVIINTEIREKLRFLHTRYTTISNVLYAKNSTHTHMILYMSSTITQDIQSHSWRGLPWHYMPITYKVVWMIRAKIYDDVKSFSFSQSVRADTVSKTHVSQKESFFAHSVGIAI